MFRRLLSIALLVTLAIPLMACAGTKGRTVQRHTPEPAPAAPAAPMVYATTPNEAGGHWLVWTIPCTDNVGMSVSSTNTGGVIMTSGCLYDINDGMSIIRWESGRSTLTHISAWTLTPSAAAIINQPDVQKHPARW